MTDDRLNEEGDGKIEMKLATSMIICDSISIYEKKLIRFKTNMVHFY